MPRQKSSIPLADRVRENQRRSRARRRELIEDLSQRLRDYEQKEAQATRSMQLAARKVLWENAQLRDLLAEKGVAEQEIAAFIQRRELSTTGALVEDSEKVDIESSCRRPHGGDALTSDWNATGSGSSASRDGALIASMSEQTIEPNAEHGHDSMSCERAANIIADMRGHGDEGQVRAQLGCQGNEECDVKNIKVFQVMEME